MKTQDFQVIASYGKSWAEVSVVIPLHNYELYIIETLESVYAQTQRDLSLVVVDDASTDASCALVEQWMRSNGARFSRACLVKNRENARLSVTRNTGAQIAESEFIFFLDADNLIYPRCIARLRSALARSNATFAYSLLRTFGDSEGLMGMNAFCRERLASGNYIDAMVLIRRAELIAAGGYEDLKYGWEDYELWLRLCELGKIGVQVPEILGSYRIHSNSMLRTTTNIESNNRRLVEALRQRYPWLMI